MAKFYGPIGYVTDTKEIRPGVFEEVITERNYYGDVVRNNRRLQTADKVNDDIDISNEISILADAFAYSNFHNMRYIRFMGAKWKISSVDVQRPRLVLSIGGLYNGS